jgi:hypothetical protein
MDTKWRDNGETVTATVGKVNSSHPKISIQYGQSQVKNTTTASKHLHMYLRDPESAYGSTGCGVFKLGIQNLKGF